MAKADNNNVMASLTARIYELMTAPDEINPGVPKEDNVFYSFAAPGVPINPSDLALGDGTTTAEVTAAAVFSQLVNNVPNPDKAWNRTETKVWDVYERAITNIDLPDAELSADEKTMLKKAQDYLVQTVTKKNPFTDKDETTTGPSPAVKAYDTYMGSYKAALQAFNAARIQANSPNASPEVVQNFNMNGPTMRDTVVAAYQKWEGEGNKGYVEQARGIIGNLTSKGPAAMYADMRASFKMARAQHPQLGTYLPTWYFPEGVLGEQYANSWTQFHFTKDDVSTTTHNSSTSWGASASGSWGLWHASASAQYGSESSDYQCDTENMGLKCELVQIPISRPWLNGLIFKSHGWKWAESSGFGPISNGQNPPSLDGMMPIFPTAMIVARNVEITLDMTSEHNTAAMKQISTQASGGWGPFSVSGNYSHKESTSTHDYTATGSGLKIPGAQIIAFVCDRLPLCPSPDPNLPWIS